MYSRAQRKFLNPEKDQANPLLGPGCYTREEAVLVTGKLFGKSGYAPFSSLAPRVSFFDQQISRGPPPGNYELGMSTIAVTHKSEKMAALFGRSKDVRFKINPTNTPGPDAYVIPSAINNHKGASSQSTSLRKLKNIASFGLTKRPIPIDSQSIEGIMHDHTIQQESTVSMIPTTPILTENDLPAGEIRNSFLEKDMPSNPELESYHSIHIEQEPIELIAKAVVTDSRLPSAIPLTAKAVVADFRLPSAIPLTATATATATATTTTNPFSVKTPKTNGIPTKSLIWKRKHIPPSIPVGSHIYGYKENLETGEMEPRKAPNLKTEEAPPFLFSFAEQAKYQKKGLAFAKGSKKGLFFRITEGPGPNAYNPTISGTQKGKHAAVLALAPCRRMTDEIINFSTKQGVPGPGSYQIKAPIAAKLSEPRNRIRFGAGKGSGYINPELMKIPGPGAYFPENSLVEKAQSKKPKPFGSSMKRFQDIENSATLPAVGSYEVDEIDSIYQKVKKNAMGQGGQRRAVFGSVSDRFQARKREVMPGPGAYDIDTEKKSVHLEKEEYGREASVANSSLYYYSQSNDAGVHAPIFGSQTTRFQDKIEDIPPPGAYNVSDSFLHAHTSGKGGGASLSSQAKRDIFKVKESIPGPGEYNVKDQPSTLNRKNIGAFLSTGDRFIEKYEKLPGPGAYLSQESGLMKKSFNSTLGQVIF